MSSITEVWGKIRFPDGGVDDWLEAETDGGHPVDEEGESWAPFFEDEHEPMTAAATIDAAGSVGEWFVRIVRDGDEVRVRSGLGDDWWCEWLARFGGLARTAAGGGAEGAFELASDGQFVGTLRIEDGGTQWVDAGRRGRPADTEGAEENGALLDEVLAGN